MEFARALGDLKREIFGWHPDDPPICFHRNERHSPTRFREPQSLQRVLTSNKIKLKKKEHTIPGLELADLLAYPFKREMVAERRGEQPPEDFGAALLNAARAKMNCHHATGQVTGYGKVWLD